MHALVPCLWFDGTAEEAAALYTRSLPGGRVLDVTHFPEDGPNPAGRPPGSVLTVEFEAGGLRFTALDGGPLFQPNASLSFFVHLDDPAGVDPVVAALGEGGEPLIPLGAYPWSDRYAWIQDRFGVSWQVIAGRRAPGGAGVVPCLLFDGHVRGRAEEAIRFWTDVFPGSHVESVEHHESGEGLAQGRFVLSGQAFAATDAHVAGGTAFSEALSLQAVCSDQAEIDRLWTALNEGGVPGPCGWLKDRFGFSWQVVPADLPRWLAAPDQAARNRVFAAMLRMGKPDVAALERAFRGAG